MARKPKRKELFALGNEAVVEGALLAGCSFLQAIPLLLLPK